jgi:hypothetical protein
MSVTGDVSIREDSPSKVGRLALGSGETKVGDTYAFSITTAQDVLGFEISVEDTERMAVFDSINNLQEDLADQAVIADILRFSAKSLWWR